MTAKEAIENLKAILEEATETEDAVSYVTSVDAESLNLAISALEKQVPIQVGYKQKQYGEYFYCPECRHTVKWIRDYEYCAYCGKAIEFPDLVSKDTNDLWLTEETLEGET